jgi:hypothetical protein
LQRGNNDKEQPKNAFGHPTTLLEQPQFIMNHSNMTNNDPVVKGTKPPLGCTKPLFGKNQTGRK